MAVDVKTVEVKKTQNVATTPRIEDTPVTTGGVVEFVGDVKQELKKITWTSPEELRVYTKLVVGMTFVLGMGIYFLDLIIHTFLSGLNFIFSFLFG